MIPKEQIPPSTPKRWGLLFLPFFVCCTNPLDDRNKPIESIFDAYLATLGVTQSVDVSAQPSYPRTRDRTHEFDDVRIRLFEFIELHECGLGELIGSRNGPLGKTMVASSRWYYERQLELGLRACEQRLRSRSKKSNLDTIEKLEVWRKLKTSALKKSAWNASLGSNELAHAMAFPAGSLGRKELESTRFGAPLSASFKKLENVLGHAEPAPQELASLHEALYELSSTRQAGAIIRAAALLTPRLRAANRELNRIHNCEIVNEIFYDNYIAHLHAPLGQLVRAGKSLQEDLVALKHLVGAPPGQNFTRYWATVIHSPDQQALLQRFLSLFGEHTQTWTRVLDRCQIAVHR